MPSRSNSDSRAPRWRRRSDVRPDEILDAALDLFVARGFAATKVTDIAAGAGITVGAIYRYFDGKAALFRAVVERVVVAQLDVASRTVATHVGTSAELVAVLLEGWWTAVVETPVGSIYKLIVVEAANFPELATFYLDDVTHRARAIVGQALQRGIDRGEFRPFDVAVGTRVALAPILFAAIYRRSLEPFDSQPIAGPEYLRFHIETFLSGIAIPDRAAPRRTSRRAPRT